MLFPLRLCVTRGCQGTRYVSWYRTVLGSKYVQLPCHGVVIALPTMDRPYFTPIPAVDDEP